ncbi:Mitochondrial outer membrane protein iml2 [Apophysomyces ossiformis]|uniref:Mitochondrial outer membrane protein iml2 n=1 Tax=Apophysomyces ossiformis TaxID=679940 RepID=A0A8H7BJF6_9FUNG|nr:Mitochondrial outer membrane protein iml2 [Apophysomyces ossiformis]
MFRQQLSNITSTLKYASSNTPNLFSSTPDPPSSQLLEFWIAETQRGLDAFFDDQFDIAESIFMQHATNSPFHAVGYSLMAFVEAMLSFESDKIQNALDRIAMAENLSCQFAKRARRRGWKSKKSSSSSPSDDSSESDSITSRRRSDSFDLSNESVVSISFGEAEPSVNESSRPSSSVPIDHAPEMQYELLQTNCMLMSATIQFLRTSWFEYMKAAYKLRKAYKMYEQMFELVTGQRACEYAASLRKKKHPRRKKSFRRTAAGSTMLNEKLVGEPEIVSLSSIFASSSHAWSEKRFNIFHRKASVDALFASAASTTSLPSRIKRRSLNSNHNNTPSSPTEQLDTLAERKPSISNNAIDSGIYFGIGLFSLIFSLLPPKVNKILNTLGFHSSRPFALHLLQKSYSSQGLYSSLSALTLLAYYTNLSLFIHPKLLPNSLSLENARAMLDQMKQKYPCGKIWKLLEGKLCKMEGKTRKGVEILRDARRRENVRSKSTNDVRINGTTSGKKSGTMMNELAQLQALAVYEMGWGQIFLGDHFQASETFFRLESMNNWSRAFYHYIATCCMFADEEYDKAAVEFLQIPNILDRKRQMGGRLLPNEVFAEHRIKRWKNKARDLNKKTGTSRTGRDSRKQQQQQQQPSVLDGTMLKQVVTVNPLWELIYLWNGISQLTPSMLEDMKKQLECVITDKTQSPSEEALLYLLLGVATRELGDYTKAELYLRQTIHLEDRVSEDRWVIPYAMYEMAALRCFQQQQAKDARDWIQRSENYSVRHNHAVVEDNSSVPENGDSDWESRLHVRCQLLLEKLDDRNEIYPL